MAVYLDSATQTIAPTVEPVTVAECRDQCRYTDTDEDPYIETLITAAREEVETITGRQLNTATWELKLDEWPDVVYLPHPPALTVATVKYYDTDNTLTTLTDVTDYRTDFGWEPGRIEPAYGKTWPVTRSQSATIVITYTAGYGPLATDVPMALRLGIQQLVAHWFAFREPIQTGRSMGLVNIPHTVDRLLAHYRMVEVH